MFCKQLAEHGCKYGAWAALLNAALEARAAVVTLTLHAIVLQIVLPMCQWAVLALHRCFEAEAAGMSYRRSSRTSSKSTDR